jgi:gamma-glutamylcyclotransferase
VFYFAYASNLSRKQMAERCPEAKAKSSAVLPNYRLVFTGWSRITGGGTATIKRTEGQRVLGGIYEVSEKCVFALDRAEGYPGTTSKLSVMVFPEGEKAVEAFTYVKVMQAEDAKPSPQYLTVLQQGYRDWGLV